MRKDRAALKKQKNHDAQRQPAIALGEAWNREVGLRAGDEAAIDPEAPLTAVNPNTWTPGGLMKVAWKEVANKHSHAAGPGGIGEARRGLDALTGLGAIARKASLKAFHAWLGAHPGNVMHVERHDDPTQLRLTFGSLLEATLQPSARYAILDDANPGRYKMVDWNAYHGKYPKAHPHCGTVELFLHRR